MKSPFYDFMTNPNFVRSRFVADADAVLYSSTTMKKLCPTTVMSDALHDMWLNFVLFHEEKLMTNPVNAYQAEFPSKNFWGESIAARLFALQSKIITNHFDKRYINPAHAWVNHHTCGTISDDEMKILVK